MTKKRNFHKCNYFQSKGLLILENCHCFKVRKHDKIKFEKKNRKRGYENFEKKKKKKKKKKYVLARD